MGNVLNVCQLGKHAAGDRAYFGRPSKWDNPFVIGRDGTREEVIAIMSRLYRAAAIAYGGTARAERQKSGLLVRPSAAIQHRV